MCDLTDWVELKGDYCCRHCFRVKFFALTRIRIRIGSEGATDSSGVTIQLKDSPGGRRRLVLLVSS